MMYITYYEANLLEYLLYIFLEVYGGIIIVYIGLALTKLII
jgi:fluoride ion exporter CrcB/FEX